MFLKTNKITEHYSAEPRFVSKRRDTHCDRNAARRRGGHASALRRRARLGLRSRPGLDPLHCADADAVQPGCLSDADSGGEGGADRVG
jgi:hypothetical protein